MSIPHLQKGNEYDNTKHGRNSHRGGGEGVLSPPAVVKDSVRSQTIICTAAAVLLPSTVNTPRLEQASVYFQIRN